MATSTRGMVQVGETTYRIVETSQCYLVVRLLDDRLVGAFRYETGLELAHAGIPVPTLVEIAKQAQHGALLAWAPRRTNPSSWFAGFVLALRALERHLASTFRDAVIACRRFALPTLVPRPVLVTAIDPSKRQPAARSTASRSPGSWSC